MIGSSLYLGRVWLFANRHIVGIRLGSWQLDFMFGAWRPLSYRNGHSNFRGHNVDLGRLGVLRWGQL